MWADGATRALQEQSTDILREELLNMLVEGRREWERDWRDLMITMAPYHDCATRLGADPSELFSEVAEQAPEGLGEHVIKFGNRTDVTPENFAFAVDEADGKLSYRPT